MIVLYSSNIHVYRLSNMFLFICFIKYFYEYLFDRIHFCIIVCYKKNRLYVYHNEYKYFANMSGIVHIHLVVNVCFLQVVRHFSLIPSFRKCSNLMNEQTLHSRRFPKGSKFFFFFSIF